MVTPNFSFTECTSLAKTSVGLGFFTLVISSSYRSIKCEVEFLLSNAADCKDQLFGFHVACCCLILVCMKEKWYINMSGI